MSDITRKAWLASLAASTIAGLVTGIILQQLAPDRIPQIIDTHEVNIHSVDGITINSNTKNEFDLENLKAIILGAEDYLYAHSNMTVNVPRLLIQYANIPPDFAKDLTCNFTPSSYKAGRFETIAPCAFKFHIDPKGLPDGASVVLRPLLSVCHKEFKECVSAEVIIGVSNY